MENNGTRRVQIHAAHSLYVHVRQDADGTLTFECQDLNNDREYEYFLSVQPDEVPLVTRALGGADGDDPLPLLAEHADDIVHFGEMRWLKSLGIVPGFFSPS